MGYDTHGHATGHNSRYPVNVFAIASRYQYFSRKTLVSGLAAGRRMASVAPCSSRSQHFWPKTLVPGLAAGRRMASVAPCSSRSQHFWPKTLAPGLAAGRRMASVAPCSSRSQQKRSKTLVPGLAAGCRVPIPRLTRRHLVELEDLVQKSPVFSTKSRNRSIWLKNRRYFQPNPGIGPFG